MVKLLGGLIKAGSRQRGAMRSPAAGRWGHARFIPRSTDPIGDFAPVAFICSYSFFMFVPNSLPVKSVSEFIAYGKANKGKLTLASPGLRHIFVASCSSTWPDWT